MADDANKLNNKIEEKQKHLEYIEYIQIKKLLEYVTK